MYAFTNATGDVIATSDTEYTLAEAQAVNAAIAAVIAGAPKGLVVKGTQTAAQPFYHRHTSGDGTSLSHYVEVPALKPLKVARAAEIDARTEELIAEGLELSTGKVVSISDCALTRYNVTYLIRNAATAAYPVLVNTIENDGVQSLANAAQVEQFTEEVFLGHRVITDSGAALKGQIIAATTVAEINAVVDDR